MNPSSSRRDDAQVTADTCLEGGSKESHCIEAMKLEEANARWNESAQVKAQVKEMKAKRIRDIEAKMLRQRDITGEGEEDQNGKEKKDLTVINHPK
jgi:hypothetical protein